MNYLKDIEPIIVEFILDVEIESIVFLNQVCKRWNSLCKEYLNKPDFIQKQEQAIIKCINCYLFDERTLKTTINNTEFEMSASSCYVSRTNTITQLLLEAKKKKKPPPLSRYLKGKKIKTKQTKRVGQGQAFQLRLTTKAYDDFIKLTCLSDISIVRNCINYTAHTRSTKVVWTLKRKRSDLRLKIKE